MTRKLFLLMACVMCFALLAGCASIIPASPPEDLNPKVRSGALVQKTNNFEMILDTSASMNTMHSWINICKSDQTPLTAMNPVMMRTTQLEYEQHLAQLFNDTIPDLKLTAGLRDFAGRSWLSRDYDTKLWYGMAPWVRTDLEKSIFAVNTYGVESPLDKALDAATMDLKPLAGKSAVIIFTDGLEMPKAPASARAMKAALGDNVCIYAVQIGSDPEAKALLEQVVKAGECGVLVNAKDVETPQGMAGFVEKVFLGPPAMAAAGTGPCNPAIGSPPGYPRETGRHLLRFRQVQHQARVQGRPQEECRLAPGEQGLQHPDRGQLRRAGHQRVQHGPGSAQGRCGDEIPHEPGYRQGPDRHRELRRGEAHLHGARTKIAGPRTEGTTLSS